MGIQGLSKLLGDNAPGCIKPQKFENYFGRKIAVDASMHIYQFMISVGRSGDQLLTNEAGDVTSHLQGMFYRTARMLESGMRPVYVFDGKPPELKRQNLDKRLERRDDAHADLAAAKESGDQEAIERASKRTIKVTKEHNEECKRLLRLMGVPVVDAPSEAEAQCAAMSKDGLVYGVATEDMDALTFGATKVIRHLMAPSSANVSINEFDSAKAIEELGLSREQFIDLCILMGCDYCGTIRGIGPVRALSLIQKHGTIEKVLEHIDEKKHEIPPEWPFAPAREFFRNPDVAPADVVSPLLKWGSPDEEGLVAFLVGEKGFSEDRVRSAVKRINSAKGKATQGRLESFFGPSTIKSSDTGAAKRKEPAGGKGAAKGAPPAKKGKLGGVGAAAAAHKKK